MYQSVPSLTIPLGRPTGNFLKGQIPHLPGTETVRELRPLGQKTRAKTPPPWQLFLKIQRKKPQNMREIMKDGTEMLISVEILKQ